MALSLIRLRARAWFEYGESAATPADILSREAYESEVVQRHLEAKTWLQMLGPFPWGLLVRRDWDGVWDALSALGC
jgi:hypothetical protein